MLPVVAGMITGTMAPSRVVDSEDDGLIRDEIPSYYIDRVGHFRYLKWGVYPIVP